MIIIPVIVETEIENGEELPAVLIMEDGKRTRITKVLYCSEAVDRGYPGLRYTIRVGNHAWYLYRLGCEWYLQAA